MKKLLQRLPFGVLFLTLVLFFNFDGFAQECELNITTTDMCFDVDPTGNNAVASTNGDPTCPSWPTPYSGWGWSSPESGNTLFFDPYTNLVNPDMDFEVTEPGEYTLFYRWDANNAFMKSVKFYSPPTVVMTSNELGCEVMQITFDVDPGTYPGEGNVISQEWRAQNGTTGAWVTLTVDPDINPYTFDPREYAELNDCGNFTVELTAINEGDNNYCTTVKTLNFDIVDLATDVDGGPDLRICENQYGDYEGEIGDGVASYTASSCGTNEVQWYSPDGLTFVGNTNTTMTPEFEADACGEYTLLMTVESGGINGCIVTDEVKVYFYDLPDNVDAGNDQEVCEHETDGYVTDLNGTYDALSCNWSYWYPNGTVLWTIVSEPSGGNAEFTYDDESDPVFTADTCGTYELQYTVQNYLDGCEVSDIVEINFIALPDNLVIQPTDNLNHICDYETDLTGFYEQRCDELVTSTDIVHWDIVNQPAGSIVTFTPDNFLFSHMEVDVCGAYEVEYTVTNSAGCTADTTEWIYFYDTPNPIVSTDASSVVTPTNPFACSRVTYYVIDDACVGDSPDMEDVVYTWSVDGGTIIGSHIGNSVVVEWLNEYPTSGDVYVKVDAEFDITDGCSDDYVINFTDFLIPNLAGQVKYWNSSETYMPSPFPTDNYSTFPEDYFYVDLYSHGNDRTPGIIHHETYTVQPYLTEEGAHDSYFGFDLPVATEGCGAEFFVEIYDGGLTYHTANPVPAEQTILGASFTYNNWGGVNATDALAMRYMVNGMTQINGDPWNYTWIADDEYSPWNRPHKIPHYGYYSNSIADVNSSRYYLFTGTYWNPTYDYNPGITALDALIVNYRSVGSINSFPNANNDPLLSELQFNPNFRVTGRIVDGLETITWPDAFEPGASNDVIFTHNHADYEYYSQATDHFYGSANIDWKAELNYLNIYYEAIGDLNASYVPTGGFNKVQSNMELAYEGVVGATVNSELTIPVSLDRDAELGAITLNLNYRNDLIEVIGTNFADDYMLINHEEGILNISWFSTESIDIEEDEAVVQITVKIIAEIPENTELFNLANTELADATANPIDVNLKTIGVTTNKSAIGGVELSSSNHPNPFKNSTTIDYTLPESGRVNVEVYNNVGVLVATLVDEAQEAGIHSVIFDKDVKAGVYIYTVKLNGKTRTSSVVKRIIVID